MPNSPLTREDKREDIGDNSYSDEEAKRRAEDVTRRLFEMPYKPHRDLKIGKRKTRTKGRVRKGKSLN